MSVKGITITGTLKQGVEVAGVLHRDFEMRLPTLGDNIDAVDQVGGHNGVAVNAALMARQLVRLGTLEPKQITYDLLCSMHPSDYNQLDAASGELEKKRQAAIAAAPNSSASATDSSKPV
ncbi:MULTISPECIES: phage tail assembly protein [unclassified Variovorax]|jgi:hypothetical protein|uniref:phage tail assembly protein n=1 Tax=unclassified Variovorax TaxID=663243 RepID=UPI000F7F7EF5|nr:MULTISPECIES: phage tail assembly protein [unclassified Variovorax]RSZ35075.1 phage tail assembly protein [Variovorax sp. 553]RSZ35907.1 phage tail assembly protein [Variovorax sp. 679]